MQKNLVPLPRRLCYSRYMIIAVDTGGTKTLIARFDGTPDIQDSVKFPTPKKYSDYIAQLTEHITALCAGDTPSAISIALPGIVENGTVKTFANLPWKNVTIARDVAPHFPGSTILTENDANLGGLGEVRLLETPPHKALYLTISTGIGTGFITDGHLSHTINNLEGGHIKLLFNDTLQEWEDFGSGSAMHRDFGKYARDIHDSETWALIVERIAAGLHIHIPILQPDLIIIGGSVGNYYSRFSRQLEHAVTSKINPIIPAHPVFMQAKYPEEAVAYGCYFNAIDHKLS